jgi:hypothetical protein
MLKLHVIGGDPNLSLHWAQKFLKPALGKGKLVPVGALRHARNREMEL